MTTGVAGFIAIAALFAPAGSESRTVSLWERHCGACHDGQTIRDGKMLADKEQMRAKYKTLDEFLNTCEGSTSCMNILKHDKRLFKAVGKEIGIKDVSDK